VDLADATALGATLAVGAVVGFDAGSFADSAGVLTAGVLTAGVLTAGVLTAGVFSGDVLTEGVFSGDVFTASVFSGGADLAGNGLAADPLDFDSLGSSMGLGLDL
jgi:hypothetical protein